MLRRHLVVLVILMVVTPLLVEAATGPADARLVAEAWTRLVVDTRGSWAGNEEPTVLAVHPLERDGRLVGHLADIEPEGWVVVPLLRELAPVKAYSEHGRIDPSARSGLSDLVTSSLHRSLKAIEHQLTKAAGDSDLRASDVLEADHSQDWTSLLSGTMSWRVEPKINLQTTGVVPDGNYQPGDYLLGTAWRQGYPYNYFIPPGFTGSTGECDHMLVGCVAVVGAQIMRYWNWPEAGTGGSAYTDPYDWANMPRAIYDTSPQVEIEAVAELSAEVGTAAELSYGCEATGGLLYDWYDRDLEDALTQNFYYDDDSPSRKDRSDMSAENWWLQITQQLNANMPIAYRVPGHAIVVDGWQEIGTTPIRQYHVNYGWGDGASAKPGWEDYDSTITWITLDELPGSSLDEEYLVENIKPDLALTYAGLWFFTANQFDDGYVGSDLYLHPYPDLYSLPEIEFVGETQFLPGMTVTCRYEPGEPEGPVRFTGTPTRPGSILSRRGVGANVRLHDGAIVLHDRGRIKVH